jgi:hypothetical protein
MYSPNRVKLNIAEDVSPSKFDREEIKVESVEDKEDQP